MITKPEVFKAYDLRGIYGLDFDEELAYKLGLVFAAWLRRTLNQSAVGVVVASDSRLSSPVLKQELTRGLAAGGAKVVDIGLAPTPTFYFAVAHYHYDGGIQVSASHNPKEYNGFKVVGRGAKPLGRDSGLEDLKEAVLANEPAPVARAGQVEGRADVLADQVEHDWSLAHTELIKPLSVVVDTANAMGALYFDELFKRLPCRLTKMNWQLDGNFPAHPADPFKRENLVALCREVVSRHADLGISTDGDADRIFFVTEKGQPVPADITRAILCRLFLADNPGAKIGYDIRPGRITRETIQECGGQPVLTRVGHTLIKDQMLKEKIYFAGESSGHFFLNMSEGCYEVPLVVTLKILAALSKSGQTFSDYIKPYEKYWHSGEINQRVSDPADKIALVKATYADGRQNELDGISVEYDDYWFNVRASNTEPLLRLNLEAVSREIMEKKRDALLTLLRS